MVCSMFLLILGSFDFGYVRVQFQIVVFQVISQVFRNCVVDVILIYRLFIYLKFMVIERFFVF